MCTGLGSVFPRGSLQQKVSNTRPLQQKVGAGKSGVGLERKKNEKTVSLRVVVVLVVRGVNLGWIVKRRSKVV